MGGASVVRVRQRKESSMTMTMAASDTALDRKAILDRINGISWYHSIPLGQGVVTPGVFDHRAYLNTYPIPARLDGMRVLDVGTFDGFWSFEFERRGAAEVVALDVGVRRDLDLAPRVRASLSPLELNEQFGRGFTAAKEILHSRVRRETLSVYELSPARLGTFDLVHSGALLLHLLNPLTALAAMRSVVGGHAVIAECYSPRLPFKLMRYLGGQQWTAWWAFSYGCLRQMIYDAGFDRVEPASKFSLPHRVHKRKVYHATFRAFPH
jgi:tRNA (mo5U34)-methyltransferase